MKKIILIIAIIVLAGVAGRSQDPEPDPKILKMKFTASFTLRFKDRSVAEIKKIADRMEKEFTDADKIEYLLYRDIDELLPGR